MHVASALTPQKSGFLRAGFTHTLNPYKGCHFGRNGCAFCYVRESPAGRFGPAPWGDWVVPKEHIGQHLARQLTPESARHYRIFMASATDPYQPLEARWQLTRQCLEVFTTHAVTWLVIQTRSLLVQRDLDLVQRLPFATLNLTVETDLAEMHRLFTRSSATPQRRLRLVRQALQQGIMTQVTVAPLLPYSADFAVHLAEAVGLQGRVIVDTFLDGDGSGGRRSERLGMAKLLASAGYAGWFARCRDHAALLLERLRTLLAPEQVLWSAEGFANQPPGNRQAALDIWL